MPLIKCKHLDIPCTVDLRHHDFLRRFKDDEEKTIPKLQSKLVELKAQLKQKMPMSEHFALKDEIKTIQRTITDLTLKKKQYFLNNSQHLFGYFEEKYPRAARLTSRCCIPFSKWAPTPNKPWFRTPTPTS